MFMKEWGSVKARQTVPALMLSLVARDAVARVFVTTGGIAIPNDGEPKINEPSECNESDRTEKCTSPRIA